MKELKMKYPNVDTTAKGDVRGSEMNSGAPKKVLKKYNDTYNAFEKKFGNKPAKNKMGGKVKKAQNGDKEPKIVAKKSLKEATIGSNPNNPRLNVDRGLGGSRSTDTTGYSAGKTKFPTIYHRFPSSRGVSYPISRKMVDEDIKFSQKKSNVPQSKMGRSVKKSLSKKK